MTKITRKRKNIFLMLFAIFIFAQIIFFATNTPPASGYVDGMNIGQDTPSGKKGITTEEQSKANSKVLSDISPITLILKAILGFMGLLLVLAATIFKWAINPDALLKTLQDPIIYEMWTFVRDVLNISFILAILFSAFCTIFQVAKFNYKKMLFTIILMALLVNFSFPIARVIIDFGNVLMYFFANMIFNASTQDKSFFASLADSSKLASLLKPDNPDTTTLIAAIVFTFMFAATMLILAILMIIRIVALAIVIIFAPIAFVGSIVPMFEKYSSQWWDAIFKYSFFGPIMMIMLVIAFKMQTAIMKGPAQIVIGYANQEMPFEKNTISAMALVFIPVIFIWMGMGVAQTMSIIGAAEAKKYGMGAMKWPSQWAFNKTGIPGGVKKGWEETRKSGKIFGFKNKFTETIFKDSQERRENIVGGVFSGGHKGYGAAKKSTKKKIFNDAAKKSQEKISDNEDTNTIVNGVSNRFGDVTVNITNTTSADDLLAFVGRYKQMKADPSAKQEFESRIRTDSRRINAAASYAATKAAASGFAAGSDEYRAVFDSHKNAYMDKQVKNEWNKLDTQYNNARDNYKP